MNMTVLQARNLCVSTEGADPVALLDGVDLALERGKTLGVVGESGSGKSMLAQALMGLLPKGVRIGAGSVTLGQAELIGMPGQALRQLRGKRIAMVFQNSGASLNPLLRVGDHLSLALQAHGVSGSRARVARALQLLGEVGIEDAGRRLLQFPHQLSGGLQQRVMIALAIAGDPAVLIADEPTTALDASVQAQVLALLRTLQERIGMAILLITHDMAVVADAADSVAVMYAGQIVEQGSTRQVLADPQHPYTLALLAGVPQFNPPKHPLPVIGGQVPAPGHWPPGCRFHPRCVFAQAACTDAAVRLPKGPGHRTACLRAPLEQVLS